MELDLKTLETPIAVSQITYLHYFELVGKDSRAPKFRGLCELLYVESGIITVHAKDFSGILESGQLIIRLSGDVCSLDCINNIPATVVAIGFDCNSASLEAFVKAPISLKSEHKRMFAEIVKEGMNIYSPPYDILDAYDMKKRNEIPFGAEQMLKLRLEMLFIELIRDGMTKNQRVADEYTSESKISEIRSYIDEHYKEKIQLDALCFLFGTNKTSLCQNFKKLYGTTVLEYINDKRINEAKRLLREKDLSITRISEQLGFSSIHYFCRLFKKATGRSAKEYKGTASDLDCSF